jgi:polysaccharide biosynthesis protein PelG
MAGIGWRLERLIHRGSLTGAAAAYATGAAVMTLPWVLTTAVLASLPAVIGRGRAEFSVAERIVNVAYAVALFVDGPLQIVISRHTADRLYERRLASIAAPFRRGLCATLLICSTIASFTLRAIGMQAGDAVWGAALSAAVGAQWTALSVGNGLCSPGLVLAAVGAGSVLSFALAAALVALAGLGVPGYLFGLLSGQCLTLAILMVGITRALPERVDENARLLPAFRDYALLAGAGFAFNISLWIDKLLAWNSAGEGVGALHSTASTLAWFSTIPCLAWIFVEVETAFHRRFQEFYADLEGGASLAQLRRGVEALVGETSRLLRGAAKVQTGVALALMLAAGVIIRNLGLPGEAVLPFRLLLAGAGFHALALLGLILLYYFDFRRDALLAAAGLLISVTLFTGAACGLGLPPSAGTIVGCAVGALLTWRRVRRGVLSTLRHAFLRQPFGSEDLPARSTADDG